MNSTYVPEIGDWLYYEYVERSLFCRVKRVGRVNKASQQVVGNDREWLSYDETWEASTGQYLGETSDYWPKLHGPNYSRITIITDLEEQALLCLRFL